MRKVNDDGGNGIGLVLSGGGAKGAFQIGAWQAICELGLAKRITAISGTSVGAINGAAIATGNSIERIKRLWFETINDVRSPDFDLLLRQVPRLFKGLISFIRGTTFPLPALLNRSKIESILHELISNVWPHNAASLYTTSLKVENNRVGNNSALFHLTRFNIGETNDWKKRIDMILASAAIPWGFPPVTIDGEDYVDGGWTARGGDNIPVAPILEKHPELKTIFVVRCNSADVEKSVIERSPDIELIEIRPEKTLPGIFDAYLDTPLLSNPPFEFALPEQKKMRIWSGTLAFDRKYTELYIKDGYYTAKKILHSYLIKTSTLNL